MGGCRLDRGAAGARCRLDRSAAGTLHRCRLDRSAAGAEWRDLGDAETSPHGREPASPRSLDFGLLRSPPLEMTTKAGPSRLRRSGLQERRSQLHRHRLHQLLQHHRHIGVRNRDSLLRSRGRLRDEGSRRTRAQELQSIAASDGPVLTAPQNCLDSRVLTANALITFIVEVLLATARVTSMLASATTKTFLMLELISTL